MGNEDGGLALHSVECTGNIDWDGAKITQKKKEDIFSRASNECYQCYFIVNMMIRRGYKGKRLTLNEPNEA